MRITSIARSAGCLATTFLLLHGARAFSAELRPQTVRGFERYVRAAEARMERDRRQSGDFLFIDSLPQPSRQQVMDQLRRGGVYVVHLDSRDDSGQPIRTPDGWIHHWLAAMFIPGANLDQVVKVDQDYDDYKNFYQPEITRSRLLEHHGDTYRVYARLQKKTPWMTITLDTSSDVRYAFLGAGRVYSESHSFRIQQVDNAGKPDEHTDPPGQGSGFLWSVDMYWRLEETGVGVMAEWETIALSRPFPFGLGWIFKPFIRHTAQETAEQFMIRTREIIRQESKRHSGSAGGAIP